jgi:hypothetical protein
MNRTVSIRRY